MPSATPCPSLAESRAPLAAWSAPGSSAPVVAIPWSAALAFIAGLLTPFTVRLVGLMPVGEFVLFAIAAGAVLLAAVGRVLPSPLLQNRLFLVLLLAQAVALAAYVVTDLYRGSTPHDMARGWARMVFLAVDFFAVACLLGRSARNFVWLLLGLQFGECAAAIVHGPLFGAYWKFGFGMPITVLALGLAGRAGPFVASCAALGFGLLHFALDYRGAALICLGVAGLAGLHVFPREWRGRLFPVGVACALFALLVANWIARPAATARADRSNIDRSAMLLAAAEAVRESPFIGQGSWFRQSDVMDNYLLIRDDSAKLAGIGGFAGPNEDVPEVSLHSQLLVSLAEGGLFGAAFFIVYLFVLLGALRRTIFAAAWRASAPLRLLVLCAAVINVFLSPFSGAHRVYIALAAGLAVLIYFENETREADEAEEDAA